eukprot:2620328-Rhodomonas_salina.1
MEFAELLLKDVSGELAKHMADQLESEKEYKSEHETSGDGKFSAMQLGPRSVYDEGGLREAGRGGLRVARVRTCVARGGGWLGGLMCVLHAFDSDTDTSACITDVCGTWRAQGSRTCWGCQTRTF